MDGGRNVRLNLIYGTSVFLNNYVLVIFKTHISWKKKTPKHTNNTDTPLKVPVSWRAVVPFTDAVQIVQLLLISKIIWCYFIHSYSVTALSWTWLLCLYQTPVHHRASHTHTGHLSTYQHGLFVFSTDAILPAEPLCYPVTWKFYMRYTLYFTCKHSVIFEQLLLITKCLLWEQMLEQTVGVNVCVSAWWCFFFFFLNPVKMFAPWVTILFSWTRGMETAHHSQMFYAIFAQVKFAAWKEA